MPCGVCSSARSRVIAKGETHSVREFMEEAFAYAGLYWRQHVVEDAAYLRPSEVVLLIGDPAKAARQLDWQPHVKFRQLVRLMMEADLKLAAREAMLRAADQS